MKKLKLLFALILSGLCLTSCGDKAGDTMYENYFEILCTHKDDSGATLYFLKDKNTDLVYINVYANYRSGFSPYYNSKGEAMKYSEFKQVHKH